MVPQKVLWRSLRPPEVQGTGRVKEIIAYVVTFLLRRHRPFRATGLLLYLLKISENLLFSDVFRYKRRPVARNGLTRRKIPIQSQQKGNLINQFQPDVAFHIDTRHFIYSTYQVIGFYMKCSTGLKWVKELNMFKINVTILLFILKSILLMGPNHNQITAMMILFTYLQEKSISITSGNNISGNK